MERWVEGREVEDVLGVLRPWGLRIGGGGARCVDLNGVGEEEGVSGERCGWG